MELVQPRPAASSWLNPRVDGRSARASTVDLGETPLSAVRGVFVVLLFAHVATLTLLARSILRIASALCAANLRRCSS
jgi:hypothetical protein